MKDHTSVQLATATETNTKITRDKHYNFHVHPAFQAQRIFKSSASTYDDFHMK